MADLQTSVTLPVSFSMEQVQQYALLTGDTNPIHTDPAAAATGKLGQVVVHGMLAASSFSTLFGTVYPGNGSVYLKQDLTFRKPVESGKEYVATATLQEHLASRHMATFKTELIDQETGKAVITGTAMVLHSEKL